MEITHFPLPEGVRIFAKLEYFNPGGSIKDRLGQELLRDALEIGKLKEGGTIIETTAGNTGIGLALAAISKNVNVIFCVPARERAGAKRRTACRKIVRHSVSCGVFGSRTGKTGHEYRRHFSR